MTDLTPEDDPGSGANTGAERDDKAAAGDPPAAPVDSTTGIPWRLGLFLLLSVVVVIFAVQNTQDVLLRFLGWEWDLPLVIVILIAVVVSVILDEILGGVVKRSRLRRRREREELARLRHQG